jgi:hypothetical protein
MINIKKTSVLRAILNIIKRRENRLKNIYSGKVRVNVAGEAFEYYIKDAFCNTFDASQEKREKSYHLYFSYVGNQNNPPDVIIRGGDAVEIKKMENPSEIQLNSSYPHAKLSINDERITEECRRSDAWLGKNELDYLYVIGIVKDWKIKVILFIYGDCYFANEGVYRNLMNKLKEKVNESFENAAQTREIGRINGVDPLGVTNLRIRGMWLVENPLTFEKFKPFFDDAFSHELSIYALIRKEKFESFPEEERKEIKKYTVVREVEIPNPDNPKGNIKAVLIKFTYDNFLKLGSQPASTSD